MKLVSILTWLGSHLAIGLAYANSDAELVSEVSGTNLAAGSMAYTGAGEVYVFDGEDWNKVGA